MVSCNTCVNMSEPLAVFRAHGKLLLTGDYLVLHGALALAIPLQKGQTLEVHRGKPGHIQWEAWHPEGLWMQAEWDHSLGVLQTSHPDKALWLTRVFQKSLELNPAAFKKLLGSRVVTRLEFDPLWGWGSSSTILSCLAQWLQLDGFRLLRETIGGSGYDLACATAHEPLFYRLTAKGFETEPADFVPNFAHQLWVVYLGKKVESSKAVAAIPKTKPGALLDEITQLTHLMAGCTFGDAFASLIPIHEALVGEYLGIEPVQSRLFANFDGQIKSLGAWGGDFILAYSTQPPHKVMDYFLNKGYTTVFRYDQIIFNKPK